MNPPTADRPLQLQCWDCDGRTKIVKQIEGKIVEEKCKTCDGIGRVPVSQCPQQEVGSKMSRQVNLMAHASNGLLPDTGGVCDQQAKFIGLWNRFRADVNLIEREEQKKK